MKPVNRLFFIAWIILSGTAGSPTPCVADSLATLKSDVEISRTTVRLSDLFEGVPVEIDRDIAKAPAPCSPAVYDGIVLSKLAQGYRLDVSIKSGDQVTVSSPCSRISETMIRDAILAKLKADNIGKRLGYDIAFDKRNIEIKIPANIATGFTLENFSHNTSSKAFRVDVAADSLRGPLIVPVTGRITIKRSVPSLAHRLESGSVIGDSDLQWIEMPEDRITADVVTETSQLVGREMRHDLQEGEIVRSRDIVPPRFVQRGSLVMMKIETPYLLITAQGKAEQDGTEGDTVRVKNLQSNRIIEGVVTAPGVVEIRTTQRKIASAE